MTHQPDLVHQGALRDFQDARRRAAIQDLKARLTGEPGNLLKVLRGQAKATLVTDSV